MKLALSLMLCLAALLPAKPDSLKIEVKPGLNPWSSLDIKEDPNRFQFAVVTDRTGGHRDGVFESGIAKLNLLQPDFVMSVGDFIEGYTTDLAEIDREWDEFTGYIKALKMPFFYVPGNHDTANPVEMKRYRERIGRDYYHFVYRDVLFLCLNSDDPFPVNMGSEQVAYAKKALAENKGVRWTLVFFHRPIWLDDKDQKKGEPTGWEPIEAALQGRNYTVFTGHRHTYTKEIRKDERYFTLATTGAGSEMRGPAWGEFDHVAWVTMTEKGPLVANVLLDGVWDENVATPQSHRMMEYLNKGVPVQEGAITTLSDTINAAHARLRCTNDADKPLKVHLEFDPSAALRPADLMFDAEVPPKSVKFFDFDLKGVGELRPRDLGPLPFDWTVSYDSQLSPPLKIAGTSRLYVEAPYAAARRTKPVVLDGKLDEWGSLPIRAENSRPPQTNRQRWTGPKDCSFSFTVEHDDKFVYVAADVTDDDWVKKGDDEAWAQDGIWINFDAHPKENASRAEKERKDSFWVMLLPGKNAAESRDVGRSYAPAGVMGTAVKSKAGYRAEASFPYSGKPGDAIALNVALYDFDAKDWDASQEGTYFHWRNTDAKSDSAGPGIFILK